MSEHKKSSEPKLDVQLFDTNVLWIGAAGVSHFSEGETLAQGLILEYDPDGNAVGVVLTRSALETLKDFFSNEHTKLVKTPESHKERNEGV